MEGPDVPYYRSPGRDVISLVLVILQRVVRASQGRSWMPAVDGLD